MRMPATKRREPVVYRDYDLLPGLWYHVWSNEDSPALRDLAEKLPHGSGLDTDWHVTVRKNGSIVLRTEWHLMDEYGCYGGWQPVTVTLSPDHKIRTVTAGRERGLTYGLADCIADTLSYALTVAP